MEIEGGYKHHRLKEETQLQLQCRVLLRTTIFTQIWGKNEG